MSEKETLRREATTVTSRGAAKMSDVAVGCRGELASSARGTAYANGEDGTRKLQIDDKIPVHLVTALS